MALMDADPPGPEETDEAAEGQSADEADIAYQEEFDAADETIKFIRTCLKVIDAVPTVYLVDTDDVQRPAAVYRATDIQMQRRLMVAVDQMRIAAADRVTRIMNSDLPKD